MVLFSYPDELSPADADEMRDQVISWAERDTAASASYASAAT